MNKRRLVKLHFLKFLSNNKFNFCISAYLFSCRGLLFKQSSCRSRTLALLHVLRLGIHD